MRFTLLGFTLFLIFGIIVFTSQGFANSLDTTATLNKIGTLKISDTTTRILTGVDLGTATDITSVNLTFQIPIPANEDVDISLKNINDVEIGSGSGYVTPASENITITLSDTITSVERSTLRSIVITMP
jgi:uncharacterized lipoprotein YajG